MCILSKSNNSKLGLKTGKSSFQDKPLQSIEGDSLRLEEMSQLGKSEKTMIYCKITKTRFGPTIKKERKRDKNMNLLTIFKNKGKGSSTLSEVPVSSDLAKLPKQTLCFASLSRRSISFALSQAYLSETNSNCF